MAHLICGVQDHGMPITPFADLDALLETLVAETCAVLGDHVAAIYLQGSFAMGEGDAFSDVDFVTVLNEDLDAGAETRLNAMHTSLYAGANPWAQHLEGSYAPAAAIRSLNQAEPYVPPEGWTDPAVAGASNPAYPFLFLGNGESSLVRSVHDNTVVVRWVLREHGIPLLGPPAAEVIDPVDPQALAEEMKEALGGFGRVLLDGSYALDALWLQGFTVLIFCRLLLALEAGGVPSKPEALRWALAGGIPDRWRGLVVDAWEQRSRYARGPGASAVNASLPPEPGDVVETLAYVRYALARAGIA
jgi:hypothetical protein